MTHISPPLCCGFPVVFSRESGMEEIKASDQAKSHQMQISIPKCSVTKGAVRQKEKRSPAGARRPQPSEKTFGELEKARQ